MDTYSQNEGLIMYNVPYSISSCESSRMTRERWAIAEVPERRLTDGQELGSYDQNTATEK